jgi:hypothetical protein
MVAYNFGLRRKQLTEQKGTGDLFEPLRLLKHCRSLGAGGLQASLGVMHGEPVRALRDYAAVPEEDLAQVAAGDPAVVRLDAISGGSFEGRLVRIRPRGEIRDNKQVFVAEVELENVSEQLRPGMKGRRRLIVHSPKTEHLGKSSRPIPLFPELLPALQEAHRTRPADAVYVVGANHRATACTPSGS